VQFCISKQTTSDRIALLGSIANSIVEDTFYSNDTQKDIIDYNSKYGKLPDDLSNIIKQRSDRHTINFLNFPLQYRFC
jgi:hypothetical protein